MKKSIFTFAIMMIMAMASFTVSAQENKRAKKARKNVASANKDLQEANADLREAKVDSLADYNAFKLEADKKIADNKKAIADLKIKKSNENAESKARYERRVAALEEKNNALENKINNAGTTKTSKWTSFKREFNSDMNDLGKSFKDVWTDNGKN